MLGEIPQNISQFIEGLYPDSGAHGKDHALKTTQLAWEISYEPEYLGVLDDRDRYLLCVGAAGHDSGYKRKSYWSGTQWEHPYESKEQLFANAGFQTDFTDAEKALVGLLVLNHDNTNYRFPAYLRFERDRNGFTDPIGWPPGPPPGIIFETDNMGEVLEVVPSNKFWAMLHILQEADSRLGDAKRTIDFSKSRNIPIFVDDGGIPDVGMPMWQYSGLANVILAAKRVLLDAYSQNGQQQAWEIYKQAIAFIKQSLVETGAPAETLQLGDLRKTDVMQYIWQKGQSERSLPHTRITQAFPLEGVPIIMGEQYRNMSVSSRLVPIEQVFHRGYVDQDKVRNLLFLRRALLTNYAIDLATEIPGALRIISATIDTMPHEYTVIPPIVETQQYTNLGTLVDSQSGYEQVAMAKAAGLDKIRVLYLR